MGNRDNYHANGALMLCGHCNFTLPKTFIHNNGTEELTTFSDVTWSRATSKYMEFVTLTLQETSFNKVIEKARG